MRNKYERSRPQSLQQQQSSRRKARDISSQQTESSERVVMGEKGAGKEKKEENQSPIEVKLDMHCEGCAHKLRRAVLKAFKDAEKVAADATSNKLKVVGKVDPWKLKEFLESKTDKKVEFISPKDPPKKKAVDAAGGDAKKAAAAGAKKADGVDKGKKKPEDKKPKAPPESEVVLKIRLHCEGCVRRIKKNIYKVKGVKEVVVDSAKDLVTVKGTMDAKSLPKILKERLNRSVEAVEAKKDAKGDAGGEKKDAKGEAGGEKKGKGTDAGKGKEKEGKAAEKAAATLPVPLAELNRMDYHGWYAMPAAMPAPVAELNQTGYYGVHGGYQVDMMHAPQLFSDENPNACSVM